MYGKLNIYMAKGSEIIIGDIVSFSFFSRRKLGYINLIYFQVD